MADQLSSSVAFGLKLSKRIYYGRQVSAPKASVMERSSETWLPKAPMVYAEISEPGIVDNPDIPSYQPYVYGLCEPPALIPLHMHGVEMEVDCYLDTAFISVSGTWRVHCVLANKTCDCRIAIPMGEQGSVLGVEVSTTRSSFYTQLIATGDVYDTENMDNAKDGCLLKRHIYTFKVSQVEGGSNLHVKVRWSQKMVYQDGQFCLCVPFTFPTYVIPVGSNIIKREKIQLNLKAGIGTQVLCKTTSHPFKEIRRGAGELSLSYAAEVASFSISDLYFSYSVCSSDISVGLLLHAPSLHDLDQREMFCFTLFPGSDLRRKVFRKVITFVVDISGSMQGATIESAKTALLEAISNLTPADSFNIIAFNESSAFFSPSMVHATNETIESAAEWISTNLIAKGGTNIMLPLNQALKMVAKTGDSVPLIFLITDGAVENERDICNDMQKRLLDGGPNYPRICTFGIGSYCNHFFLQMLAQIGRGHYDAAYDIDSITFRMQRLFDSASSLILTNIKIDALEHIDKLEMYPCRIPDLSTGCPVIVSGRYSGNFPDSVEASGILSDLTRFVIDVKAQKAKDIPLDRVLAKRHIDTLTCHAWLSGSKQLEEKVVKMSIQTGIPSEYTSMILVQTDKGKQSSGPVLVREMMGMNGRKVIFLRNMGTGFGDLTSTSENLPLGSGEPKLHVSKDFMMKAASNFCGRLMDRCCCMCFIQLCSQVNDKCAVAFTQLCTALACFQCLSCCCEICDSCDQCCG
ncbi:Inter-alpha-trypsin inhibitor heavy chain [Heracleum sosnowskyi]|uniref:Inter-alpha-trypsin inhibitor heavy chain n=1 Tax=Heracleum sosnowskyi TaxID=360622 RepID=A0AAD8H2M9_9APIA|nr:Inter-alpha-trypsin inhibitor heavy chain [Heracleum sosnowskyi]